MPLPFLRAFAFTALLLMCVLVGCGGGGGSSSSPPTPTSAPVASPIVSTKPSPSPTPTATAPASSSVTVTVVSAKPYTDTGLQVYASETLDIVSTGTIDWSTACTADCNATPNGIPGSTCPPLPGGPFTAPELPCYSLIGKIGTNGTPFEVGGSLQFAPASAGELYLGVNDNYYPDNTGSWQSTITLIK